MDNKKKICIGIIVVLILFIITFLVLTFLKYKNMQVTNDNTKEIQENFDTDIIDILEESNEDIENIIDENDMIENISITNNDIIENSTSIKEESSSTNISTNNEQSSQTQTNVDNIQSSSIETEIETTTPRQEAIIQTTLETPVNTVSKEVQMPTTSQEVTESYVRNDVMINTIKQIIQNNETDNMKNFGYTIEVDSSITNDTNQFTYSEARIINSIRNKFGTIKIYAEDCYKNGQFIMTQCYIL